MFTNKVFLAINNPLISKKIDVVKTCQSNIIRVDVTNRNGFVMRSSSLHHHNIMGTHQFSPHLYVFSHDQLRKNWSRFNIYWYENISSEMTKYQLARQERGRVSVNWMADCDWIFDKFLIWEFRQILSSCRHQSWGKHFILTQISAGAVWRCCWVNGCWWQ